MADTPSHQPSRHRPAVPYWEPPDGPNSDPPPPPVVPPRPVRNPAYGVPAPESWPQRTPRPVGRPRNVVGGAIMTWVGGGFEIVVGLVFAVGSTSDRFVELVREPVATATGFSPAMTALVVLVLGLVALVTGTLPVVFAGFAFNGHNWARIALTVVGALYVAFMLLSLVSGSGSSLLGAAWTIGALVAFWSGSAGEWYRYRSGR